MSMSRIKKNILVFPGIKDMIITLAVLAAEGAAGMLLIKFNAGSCIQPVFVLGAAIVSRFTNGYLCGFTASLAGLLAVNYAFTYPYFKLDFSLAGCSISFTVTLAVSVFIVMITTGLKNRYKVYAETEKEKMSGNILRAISHDIRTPLTAISGAAQGIIENRGKIDEDQLMSLVGDIKEGADRLLKMAENILTITRIKEQTGDIRKTPEAAEEVIGEAIREFRKTRTTPVETEIPGELIMVPMDYLLIEHVIVNMMENSVIHGGATIIYISLERKKDKAVFRISDNGTGISEEMLDKLFTGCFVHADEKNGDAKMNMGIGLSVCSAIISVHNGNITAGNTAEGGAVFTFTLPIDIRLTDELNT